ncbi:DMT family transporter [Thalassotalea euphylliae]|uniref:DMT family transporter n=1 Tax=Thalassotalea euphylliae TaxID=1655234 RepID=UPI0036322839
MSSKSFAELMLLAAIWGASFLFMRIGSPEFGPLLFMALRTLTAALFLTPFMVLKKQHSQLHGRWHQVFIMGAFNTAIPFALFAYAVLSLSAGVTSVLNATTPIFGAIVAFFWLKDKITPLAMIGLALGFIGVYVLMSDRLAADAQSTFLPALACLAATFCYAIAANYTKQYMSDIKPLALAAGSQISSAAMLLPLGLFFLPNTMPSGMAWLVVVVLGVLCTGLAYIIFFRLIADVGPTKAISVTYLIPVFGLMWGSIFLDEAITLTIIAGCGSILTGVGLTTGFIGRRR